MKTGARLPRAFFQTALRAAMLSLALLLCLPLAACGAARAANASQASAKTAVPSGAASKPAAPASSASESSAAAPSSVPASSSGANGRTVCLDPGHQAKVDLGTEPIAPGSSVMKVKNPGGATGVKTGATEYALNLTVALKLRAALTARGYRVVMTRETNDANISNVGRAELANASGAQLFVRIHADSAVSSSVTGVTVLIPGSQYISDASLLSQSRRAGDCLLGGVVQSTGAKSRGLSVRNDMTGFNWCKIPMVLVEMGFLSNPGEDSLMNTPAYQDKLVYGFVSGIDSYFSKAS